MEERTPGEGKILSSVCGRRNGNSCLLASFLADLRIERDRRGKEGDVPSLETIVRPFLGPGATFFIELNERVYRTDRLSKPLFLDRLDQKALSPI